MSANRPPVPHLNASDPPVAATRDLAAGEEIGFRAGTPFEPIAPGQHVQVHDVEFHPSAADYAIGMYRSNRLVLPQD